MRRAFRRLDEPSLAVAILDAVLVTLLLLLGVVLIRAPKCTAALVNVFLPTVEP